MNRFILGFTIFCLPLIINLSCSKILCGSLDKEYQDLIDSVNTKFKDSFSIEYIPCEFNYINLKLNTQNLDSTLVREAHQILYNPDKKTGWPTILIYDDNKNYIISHSKNNKFYYQTGD